MAYQATAMPTKTELENFFVTMNQYQRNALCERQSSVSMNRWETAYVERERAEAHPCWTENSPCCPVIDHFKLVTANASGYMLSVECHQRTHSGDGT